MLARKQRSGAASTGTVGYRSPVRGWRISSGFSAELYLRIGFHDTALVGAVCALANRCRRWTDGHTGDMAKQWQDLSDGQRKAITVLGFVQLALALAAWIDLARRPADQVDGSKAKWAAVIGINFLGPLRYFTKGRVSAR